MIKKILISKTNSKYHYHPGLEDQWETKDGTSKFEWI